ncbi:M56 family metallopeptidase [Amycolatopsis alkalitolerans]|uniref:M56 family metallopeptidase n=2 Tax=Amycolatopsis alkalitolerans TaxID=2547244 RepID=A0A5C4M0M6_9PSEU|nr:M56 family metallopeptidase [Amycolatopsis alkalitolerans]
MWLITGGALALAAASTAALCVLALAGLSLIPLVARLGEWSPAKLRGLEIASIPVEALSGVLLIAIAVSTVVSAVGRFRWLRGVVRSVGQVPARAGLVVLPDMAPLALAVPWRGGGRIVVSRSMLDALTTAERRALLAHERAHLRGRHHVFLTVLWLSATLNPLLWPLRSAGVFVLERHADEEACRRVGSRRVVASAIAKAALAGRMPEAPAPAATGGPVPRRVAALLHPPAPRLDWRFVAGAAAALTFAIALWSAVASLDAAADLHAGIEVASITPVHHHHDGWPRP